jgi:hypothetical protein
MPARIRAEIARKTVPSPPTPKLVSKVSEKKDVKIMEA